MSKVHRGSGWCWDLVQHLLQTWLFKPFEAYLLTADYFIINFLKMTDSLFEKLMKYSPGCKELQS